MSEFRRRLLMRQDKKNMIATIFNVIANQSISILSSNFDLSQIEKIKVDGSEIPISTSHIFSKSGNIKVDFYMREDSTSCVRMFGGITAINYCDLSYIPTNIISMERMFYQSSIENVEIRKSKEMPNLSSMYAMFLKCNNLKNIDLSNIVASNCNLGFIFENCWYLQNATMIKGKNINGEGIYLGCERLISANDEYMEVLPITNASYYFLRCNNITNWNPFYGWKQYNFNIPSDLLTAESIHRFIERSASVADGATQRTLTLSAIAKSNWMASEYYTADQAMATEKLITIN